MGSSWVSNATKDHTLVRKCSVEQGNSDWLASAGTNTDDSEWLVLEQNDWTNLGSHTVGVRRILGILMHLLIITILMQILMMEVVNTLVVLMRMQIITILLLM